MTDTPNLNPLTPQEDRVLDRHLASLGHFSPKPGFPDLVMARVRVASATAPTPAPGGLAPRRRRWPVLVGSLSGLAAMSSSILTALVALNFGPLTQAATAAMAAAAVPAWHAALAWLAAQSTALGSTVLAAVLTDLTPLIRALAIATLAVPVSLIGFVLVARSPLRTSHASR